MGPLAPLIAASGPRASYRFLEFFNANIRNAHTRRAYARGRVHAEPAACGFTCTRRAASATPCHHNLEADLHAYIVGAGLAHDPRALSFQTHDRSTGRLTGNPVTANLKNGGTLEKAAQMANHASTRTTQLYDRRAEEVTLDEVERVQI
jgi:hypothetical protein